MLLKVRVYSTLLIALFFISMGTAQIVINEGSNRNYQTIPDEDGAYPDWIELYNTGSEAINLLNYSLTDELAKPTKWVFPNVSILPGEFKVVFCSGNDRKPITGFKNVITTGSFNPVPGWNTHTFTTPFYWDGVSNILVNVCSYNSVGYTTNSVFNQTETAYPSTIVAFQDGSPYICSAMYGSKVSVKPNIKFNDVIIGTGTVQNSPTDYPAPYGNWYWAAKNQILYTASELAAAGLTAGDITSLAFDVVSTDPNTTYDYIDINMKLVITPQVTTQFETVDPHSYQHTNFKLSTDGETVYLFSPAQTLEDSLVINCKNADNSTGSSTDASTHKALFQNPTPGATNGTSATYSRYLAAPAISIPSGLYNHSIHVTIDNPNTEPSVIHYTTDGSDPGLDSPVYDGTPIAVSYSGVVKARAFADTLLSSPTSVSSYLLGVSHTTPILSVVTDNANLYGETGIFDNWPFDWERAAYVEYFDTAQTLIFSQHAGIQIDGGAGGSRAQPQHSFRVELDHPVVGDGPVDYPLIPNRSERTKYSKFYLRNGSNQYLVLPYKDASQVEMMAGETNVYYSAWRPVTVYINGNYFGLYELREKIDDEYFETLENANIDSTDLLSLSYWNGSALRALNGSVDPFYEDYIAFNALDPADPDYWDQADQYFDMKWYNDYIIAQSWMPNTDWPYNNIKLYRSDKTDFRWRFCVIDLELALGPNGWTDCYADHIGFMLVQDAGNPFINIWLKGIQNARFRNYFINRFADVMNTQYRMDRILAIEQDMFNQTVLEMPREYARWGDVNNISQQMTDFTNRHLEFRFQLAQRTAEVRNHIQAHFDLTSQVDVTLEAFPVGSGIIKISTIVPDSLPWTGVYFDGNPVEIKAIPNPGYDFAYWDTNAVLTEQNPDPVINLNISSSTTFKAVFTPGLPPPDLAISELNYHPDSTRNSGDWIEVLNFGDQLIDLSGWTFTDGQAAQPFIFPNGTMLSPGQRLVIAEDPLKFNEQHPGITVAGPLAFEFSNSTETLSFYNTAGTLITSITYEDSSPWPKVADGVGRTLELTAETADPNLPGSWFAGCIGGSPGTGYIPCSEQIIISEINYKSSATTDAGDWIELKNTGASPINISGWTFSDEDDAHLFVLPAGTVVPSSGYLVLYSDAAKFSSRFPNVTTITGPFTFGLSSTGEALRLFDVTGRLSQSLVYDVAAPWPQGAAGNGYTLELVDQHGNFSDGGNWTIGCLEGSPGGPLSYPCTTTGISSVEPGIEINLFPNPTSGKFTIDINEDGTANSTIGVDIFNLLGAKVYSTSNRYQTTPLEIDLDNVPNGLYTAKIYLRDKMYTQKFIIARSTH